MHRYFTPNTLNMSLSKKSSVSQSWVFKHTFICTETKTWEWSESLASYISHLSASLLKSYISFDNTKPQFNPKHRHQFTLGLNKYLNQIIISFIYISTFKIIHSPTCTWVASFLSLPSLHISSCIRHDKLLIYDTSFYNTCVYIAIYWTGLWMFFSANGSFKPVPGYKLFCNQLLKYYIR